MKIIIKENIYKNITRVLVILILLTFILPYYAFAAKNSEEEKGRGAVPTAAAEVLKGITTIGEAATTTSSTDTVSTDYPEDGFGYYSLTEVNGTKYKNYKQADSDIAAHSFSDGNMQSSGCGPTSIAIVASGYGIDKTPIDIADMITAKGKQETGSAILSEILDDLGISHNTRVGQSSNTQISEIRKNLEDGNPVLVGINGGSDSKYSSSGHWMAVLGISGDTITISNPGVNDNGSVTDNLSDFVNKEMSGCSYILITQSRGSNSSSTNSSSVNKNNTSSDTIKDGVTIHKSERTGREFKIYKQNEGPWSGSSFVNGGTIGSMGCPLVADAIICSGYGHDLDPGALNSKYSSYCAGDEIAKVTNFYNHAHESPSKKQMVDHLLNGGTLIIHTYAFEYASYGHWMAVVDIKEDGSQIYIGNPDIYGSLQGWAQTDDVFSGGNIVHAIYVPNEGGSGSYGGETNSNSSASSYSTPSLTSNISKYIVPNNRGGYKIDIDLDKKVDEMLDILKEQNNRDIDNFLKTSSKKEILKSMLKAELVTQFPDLRSIDEMNNSNSNEKQLKEIEKKLPNILENLNKISLKSQERQVENQKFDTEEELDNVIDNKLADIDYEEEDNGENTNYTYTQNNIKYRLEKIGNKEYFLYEIENKDRKGNVEKNVFNNIKNSKNKIYNIITGGRITTENVRNFFYTNISYLTSNSGYNENDLLELYMNYINKIYDELTKEEPNIVNWLTGQATSTPDEAKQDELQGVIHIKRKTTNGSNESEIYLSYIPYDEFKNKCQKTDKDVLKNFTINSNGAIVVAKYKEFIRIAEGEAAGYVSPEHTYEITESAPIAYLSQIYQHTMPFDLLWTLLVYGGDYNFINELANLVYNTKITITALDNISDKSQTINKEITVLKKDVLTADTDSKDIKSEGQEEYETHVISYTERTIDDSVELKVSYIDSWIATYTNNNEVASTDEKQTEEDPITETSDWEDDGEAKKYDSVSASKMVEENSSLLKQYKDLMKKNIKSAAKKYNKKKGAAYTVAKKVIQDSENLQDIYINDITNNVLAKTNSSLEQIFKEAFHLEIDTLSVNVQNQIKKESKDKVNVQNAVNDILIDIYNNLDWKVDVESLTVQKKKKTETITKTATKISTYKYSSASGQIVEKTNRNTNEDNFITILDKNGKAKGSLRSIASWMFESIEKNKILCDKLDLMKYLLGKAFGSNYGVKEFDFGIYDPENFSSIGESNTSLTGTSAVSEFLKAWENYAMWQYINGEITDYNSNPYIYMCITQDKKSYKMCDDLFTGHNNRNFGFGVCFYAPSAGYGFINTDYFKDEGINIREDKYQHYGTSTLPVDLVDRIKEKIIENQRNSVKRKAQNLGIELKDYQIDAVAACQYQGWEMEDFLSAYKQYGLNESIRSYSTGMGTSADRYEANWKLFSTGKYTDASGKEIVVKEQSGGSIIECAKKIHTYMEKNKYTYCALDWSQGCDHTDGHGLNNTFEESKNGYHHTCCATYVSWVLREAGYMNETKHNVSGLVDYLESHNWKKVSASELKAGDVMIKPGKHTQIYAGNGQIYNAGYTGAIQRANPYNGGSTSEYYGLRAPNK